MMKQRANAGTGKDDRAAHTQGSRRGAEPPRYGTARRRPARALFGAATPGSAVRPVGAEASLSNGEEVGVFKAPARLRRSDHRAEGLHSGAVHRLGAPFFWLKKGLPRNAAAGLVLGTAVVMGMTPGAARAQGVVTAPTEGAGVRITVAQEGPSLVSDRRTVTLPAGRSWVRVPGVAARLDPKSAEPVFSGSGRVEVLEQRFRYDTADQAGVLRRYVGSQVTLLRAGLPPLTGTLRTADDVVVLETAEGLLVNPAGTFSVPNAPNFAAQPVLEWLVEAAAGGQYALETRYATTGLQWSATYRASLNAAHDRLTLRGWLNLQNDSGTEFRGAMLTFRAGKTGAGGGTYGYARPVDLPRKEAQQLSYVSATELPVTEELVFFAAEAQPNFVQPYTGAPQLALRLQNSAGAGLGASLPGGPISLWDTAADGSLRTVAERALPPLVRDQRFTLTLSPATGIQGARTQVAQRQLNPLTDEHTIQVELTNTRTEAVTVSVLERLPPNAKLTDSSVPGVPGAPGLVEFRVPIPAGAKAVLKYVVEVKK